MKPTLQLRLSQQLTLTPQLQQSIRLLQLSTAELNQEIERALMENPILEREDGGGESAPPPRGSADALSRVETPVAPEHGEDLAPDYAVPWRGGGDDDDEGDRTFSAPDTPTFRDHLYEQLSLTNLDGRDRARVAFLIDLLDEDGYLTQSLEEAASMLSPGAETGLDELAIALRHLQNFEPSGVGARSPGECLALQIRAQGASDPVRVLALRIVEHHLELLAAHDYARLRALTGATDEALRAAQQFIRSLNPRPGAAYAKLEARYVVPDVIVRRTREGWRASLNPEAMPRLRSAIS